MEAARDTPIEIACAARADYLPHTATMLASALRNAGAPVRAHLLLGADVGDDDARELTEWAGAEGATLTVHRVDDAHLKGFGTTSTLPLAHWYRTLLPDLLPGQGRVIYLDSDLLVLGPLTALWTMDLRGHSLAAATNTFPDPDAGAAYCRALGIDPPSYFNTGVMLLDLEQLRAGRSFERIREFARKHGDRLILPEQDATVAVLAERRLPLDPHWNAMVGEDAASAPAEPAIRHFEGSRNKPWLAEAPGEDRRLWESFRSQTPWARDGHQEGAVAE